MGWKICKGRRYFYEYTDVNGERVWKCWGCGGEAVNAAARVQRERAEKRRFIQLVRAYAQEDAAIDKRIALNYAKFADELRWMYRAAGYHQHKGQWRKARNAADPGELLMELKNKCELGREGSSPGWADAKGLENEIRLLSLESLRRSGHDDIESKIDAVMGKLSAMRVELVHEKTSALEHVLIEQMLTAWVQWYVASLNLEAEGDEPRNWRQDQYLEKRYTRCQNRLSRLIDQMSKLRSIPYWYLLEGRRQR